MIIQVVSDLHMEAKPFSLHAHADAEVMVLAGDIIAMQNGAKKLYHLENLIKHLSIPVVYVTGNHEYYGFGRVKDINAAIKGLEAKYPHFHFLDNEVWVFNDVEFIGSTLWSNFDLAQNKILFCHNVELAISDFSQILSANVGRIDSREMIALSNEARQFIDKAVRVRNKLKKVVVTHFAPTISSIHERYEGNLLNPYFICDCEQLMPGVHTWIHGHVHNSFDYMLTRVRSGHTVINTHIVCNPRGYDRENKSSFESQKIIVV
jgi:predicted phosphohydrolase